MHRENQVFKRDTFKMSSRKILTIRRNTRYIDDKNRLDSNLLRGREGERANVFKHELN
jgi:hypothetical protein